MLDRQNMTKIISKRSQKRYFGIVFCMLIFVVIGTIPIYTFYDEWLNSYIKSHTFFMFIFGILMYFIVFALAKIYIKNSAKIILNSDKILIKDKIYYWKDIKNIEMTGKKKFGLFIYPMEATTLEFENNTIVNIFDDMYSNSWKIKSFIKQIIVDKKDKFEISINKTDKKEIENEYFEVFRGSPFFSFRGIILWSLILLSLLFLLFIEEKISRVDFLKIFIPLGSFWFVFNSYCMHYFELSKNYFVIKNHFFWWIKTIYKNSEIENIVFENQSNRVNSLRIISKNYKQKVYLAGTLNNKKWLKLKTEFEGKNIKVRNECIF
jgi:hypothetical protein